MGFVAARRGRRARGPVDEDPQDAVTAIRAMSGGVSGERVERSLGLLARSHGSRRCGSVGNGRYCAGMQAAVQTRYGPPDVVRIVEVEKPTIEDNEVLVQVYATTVNRTDCACRAAKPFFMRLFTGLIRPRATVLGNEYAGVVEAVGGGVTAFSVGEKVFGYNEGPFGAHAQYLAIPEDGSLTTMSANVTFEEAAPSTEGAHYALAHIRGAKITGGQDVLVYGATGAIGSASVQLLKSLGVNVTAVCDTDHMDLVTGLGADRVIDYTTDGFHPGRSDLRRGVGLGGQELLQPMPAASETGGNLHLVGARSSRTESVPGAHRSAPARKEGHVPDPEA